MKRTYRWNNLKEAAQKMNEKFSSMRESHDRRIPFERSNNQLINANIIE